MKMLPILVLASSFASASASAVTIDSPEVGQFFKLPSWAPAAVDSEHTPGSPETVVDVYSNAVKTTEWEFGAIRWFPSNSYYAVSFTPTNAVQPTYVKGRGWDLSASLESLARIVPRSEGSNSYSAPGGSVVAADEGAGSLTISVHYSATRQVNGQWYSITTDFTWTLTAKKQETEPVNTGRKAVRPVRLVPEMFSSFYGTLEAYYERAYYSCAGERNVWDVDIYGPLKADHLFRFDLPDGAQSTLTAFWCEFQYHSWTNCTADWPEASTNRTILTRRLVDGDNVQRLATAVHGYGDWDHHFPQIYVDRPGWQNLEEYASTLSPKYLVWSSTIFDALGLADGFPELNWTRFPLTSTTTNDWSRVFTGWRDLAWDSRAVRFDWSLTYYYKTIPRLMFERVNFGEPPFDDVHDYGGPMPEEITSPLEAVTEEVLAHPYGDRSLITNAIDVTRRLNLSKLGQLNQALACLDRTYYAPQEYPKLFGTSQGVRGYRRYESAPYEVELAGDFHIDSDWHITVASQVDVPQPAFTFASTNAWASNYTSEYAVAYSDPSHSWLFPDNNIDAVYDQVQWVDYGYWRYSEFLLRDFIIVAENMGPGVYDVKNGPFQCVPPAIPGGRNSVVFDVYLQNRDTGENSEIIATPGWDAPLKVRCRASASYERSYECSETTEAITTNGVPMAYPGEYSRAGECKFTSLLAVAGVTGNKDYPVQSSSPWRLAYSRAYDYQNYWTSGYKTYADEYVNAVEYRAMLRNRAGNAMARCAELVAGAVGARWNNPAMMIPMSDADVARWLGHLKTDVTVGVAGGDGGWDVEWIRIEGDSEGGAQFAAAGYYDGAGNMIELPIYDPDTYTVGGPSITLTLDVSAEPQYRTIDVPEHYGALSNGKQSGCARVDWSWNCLRLNKDE